MGTVLRHTAYLIIVFDVLVTLSAAREVPGLSATVDPLATPVGAVRFYFHALNSGQCDLAYKFADRGRQSLRAFLRECRSITSVSIEHLQDPGYRLHAQTAAYTCLAVRYTVRRRGGSATSYGGWYLMERTLGPAWSILYQRSHVTRAGRPVRLTKAQCADHLPLYVSPGAGTVISGSAFLSARTGWIALSTSGNYLPGGSCSHGIGSNCESAETTVYRTSDAGRHWTSILHVTTAVGPPIWIRLFNARVGMVAATVGPLKAAANERFTSALFSTHDGGLHWQRFPLPTDYATEAGSISFPDWTHGWVWYGGGAMGRMAIQMYRTQDGGRHWSRTYCTLIAPNPQAPFACPHPGSGITGLATDLIFTGPSNGWLTAYSNAGIPDLYHTANGGVSWYRQRIGLPPGIATPTTGGPGAAFPFGEFLAPAFAEGIGLLPENVGFSRSTPKSNWDRLYIFRSTDGGRSWPLALRTPISSPPVTWQAVDRRHWIVTTAPPSGTPNTIWSTANAGVSWTRHRLGLPAELVLSGLHFADARNGWATAQPPDEREVSPLGTVLLRTRDSGKHWAQVRLPG
jgi:photosystem II stability/assembly factor-like uncharacterized protein